jgi:antitoxin component of MazEF toxin-antitoxin module
MPKATFEATLKPSGRGGGGHLVEVPAEVVAKLGGAGRITVEASFNRVPYRGSIVRMGGVSILGVLKAIMKQAGVHAGDTLLVVVENDEEPREVEVPDELAKALRRNRAVREIFDSLSFSHRREYVQSITEAKRPETRARRVDRTIETLEERAAENARRERDRGG